MKQLPWKTGQDLLLLLSHSGAGLVLYSGQKREGRAAWKGAQVSPLTSLLGLTGLCDLQGPEEVHCQGEDSPITLPSWDSTVPTPGKQSASTGHMQPPRPEHHA